jgi:hypothetical protein
VVHDVDELMVMKKGPDEEAGLKGGVRERKIAVIGERRQT